MPGPAVLLRTVGGLFRPAAAPGEAALPGTLDYTGEFGAELVLFLPWCNWLSRQGLLRTRRIRTYRGMRCFYEDLDCGGIQEKDDRRHYVPPGRRALPVRDEHGFDRGSGGGGGPSPFLLYPDLRRRFAAMPAAGEWARGGKPLLVIHNKYNAEWDGEPANFIPLDCLDVLFAALEPRFTVVYIRHGAGRLPPGYSGDEMGPLAFADRAVLDRYPGVLAFDDLFAAQAAAAGGTGDLNTFKNMLYSRCHFFISSQGGGAHHMALFSGSLLVVLHRRGREVEWAYAGGYYGFMANPAPVRAICRTEADLIASLGLFEDVAVVDGRVLLAPARAELLRRLSPWRLTGQG